MPTTARESTRSPKINKKVAIILLGVLFVFLLIAAVLSPNQTVTENGFPIPTESQTSKTNNQNNAAQSKSAADTVVYGTWKNKQSLIKSVDLSTNALTTLAALPLNVKKVNVVSPTQLLYIDQTDSRDHGRQIALFDIKSKKSKSVMRTDPGFGIDDYALSPNKRYLAVWEVAFAPGSEILQGGKSRVYGVDLNNPGKKYLLFDETSSESNPVHYPQAVSNSGRVFADRFLPNDPAGGAGWAYGMSVIDFDGKNKKELSQMQKGTYGTQPMISPDGKLLVFSGYDGKNGPGDKNKNGYGFRQAILSPNTVEFLDTESLSRTRITGFSNNNIYSTVNWGDANSLVLTILSRDEEQTGIFVFDTKTKTLKAINLPSDSSSISYSYVANLSGNGLLIGMPDPAITSTGNLGEGYLPSLTKLYVQKSGSNQANLLYVDDVLVQHITVLPPNYFKNVLAITAEGATTAFNPQPTLVELTEDKYTRERENLQLRTFELPKQDLTTKRETQQSKPKPTPRVTRTPFARPTNPPTFVMDDCTDLAEAQCAGGLGLKKTKPESKAFRECVKTNKEKNRATIGTPYAVCSRSPLYVYGQDGQNVSVKIQTTVYDDNPKYKNIYSVKLLPQGIMQVDGSNYDAINYNYKPNIRVLRPPAEGTIVSLNQLEAVIRNYADKLGLNDKETENLVIFAGKNVKSPYVFFSFYDHELSSKILPLKFYPQPDNYLNIVFYFKQHYEEPNYTPLSPVFPDRLNRSGLTAVEISEIVE